ncbi:hypothetical protein H0A36_03005 [Endozoicomonas sp. SM1973]|uniref:Uncharacterized protein n=1 Tax=Spartinivicinus marinus TaxID=2994442 RepID=A0A853I4S8_9GAMM|nr:hypothetical protein [Spartinivicinus marinus]MCX4029386.1 hypothetical protein [Spartinivicinus marinus]NYZ64961.1 hypothetical protein [Spartinivicinus marinus]
MAYIKLKTIKILTLAVSNIIVGTALAGSLDANRYEIQDIRVETDLAHGQAYQIYANRKMQAPVYIKVKAINPTTRQAVTIPVDELISASYLFGKQSGLNFTYNQYFSTSSDQHWFYTVTENQYQHTVPRSAGIVRRSVSPSETTVRNNPRLANGWSQLTYWVSTNQTHYSKHVCAEIAMSNGETINSCDTTLYDEYATISAIDPLQYRATDFSFDFHYLKKTDSWYVGYWQLTPNNKQIKIYGLEWENPLQEGNQFFRAMNYFRPGGSLLRYNTNTTAYSLILYPYKPSIEPQTMSDYVRIWNIEGKKREDYHFELPLSTNNVKFVQGKGSYDDYKTCIYITRNHCSHTRKNGHYVNMTSNDAYHYDLRPKFNVFDQFGNAAHLKLVDSNTIENLGWDNYQIMDDES